MSSVIAGHLFLGPLLLAAALFFKVRPPRSMNSFLSYRTPRALRSQQIFVEANRYFTSVMFRLALLVILLQAGTIFFIDDQDFGFTIARTALFAAPIFAIFATERHLKKNFDKDGKRIAY